MSASINNFIYNNGNAKGFADDFRLNNMIQPDLSRGYSEDSGKVERPEKLLEQTLAKRIDGFVPVNEAKNELIDNNFSPEAVAGRILDFVESSIEQRAGSAIEAQSLLQQAREGIAQGFAEARDILNALSKNSEEIDTRVDNTENLIFQGLDRLNDLYSDVPQTSNGQLISETGSFSSQFKQSNDASLEIVTRDGDRVAVSYSAFIQTTTNQLYELDQKSAFSKSEFSAQSTTTFQFKLQGNIDEGEKEAINNLLKDVGELAKQFFQGDVQAAFNAAQDLGFDSKELKSFALDFKQSTQIQVAQTYQQTESFSPSNIKQQSRAGPASAVAALSQLDDLIALAEANLNISEPEKTVKSLLINIMDLLGNGFEMPLKKYI